MKIPILLLALCLSASAAPPVPVLPTVTRPAPLLSPKAASAPKVTPMFVPASVPLGTPPLRLFLTNNVTIIGIDGNPEVVDWIDVEAVQPAGFGARIYMGGDLTAPLSAWNQVADFGPYVEDQVVGWLWYRQPWTRTCTLFFRRVLYAESSTAARLIPRGVTINKALPGRVMTYTKPLKKGLFRK